MNKYAGKLLFEIFLNPFTENLKKSKNPVVAVFSVLIVSKRLYIPNYATVKVKICLMSSIANKISFRHELQLLNRYFMQFSLVISMQYLITRVKPRKKKETQS